MSALLATSFAAGLVSIVNPCGFAMLPAYLSYFLGTEGSTRFGSVRRALRVSGLVSLGFVTVFGVAGLLIVAGVRVIIELVPWLAVAVGAGLIVYGIAVLRGRYLTISLGPDRVGRGSVFGFGVSYAIASLSCTLPIFLSLIAGTFTQTSLVGGLAAFLVYAAGMSLVLTAITVTLALGRDRIVRLIRRSAKHVTTLSGIVLVLAGLFIIWYWATVLAAGSVALADNPVIRWVDQVSSSITELVRRNTAWVVVGLVAVGAAAVLLLRRSPESDRVTR